MAVGLLLLLLLMPCTTLAPHVWPATHLLARTADYPNHENFILHYADMVDSTSLTNLLKW